jgi:hypothetical protein
MKTKITCTYLASILLISWITLILLCKSVLSEEQKTGFSTNESAKDHGKKLTIEEQEKLARMFPATAVILNLSVCLLFWGKITIRELWINDDL